MAPAGIGAESGQYQLGFGPFVGSGDISTGAKVRHTSGYTLSVERPWQVAEMLSMGPRVEVSNAFVNTLAGVQDTTVIGTYDNRIVAAGLTLHLKIGNDQAAVQALYATALAGRGYSKLSVDESTAQSSQHSLYSNMSGNWFGGELGIWLPLRGSFGINVAVISNRYQLDQSQACGTYNGDQVDDTGGLSLTQGAFTCGEAPLARNATLRTVAGKISLGLGF